MTSESRNKLNIPDEVVLLVRGLHPLIKATIRSALSAILKDPYAGKPLKDELQGLRSYRVKRYRIIYRVSPDNNSLDIIAIGPRKNIYEETFRAFRNEK